MAKIKKNLSFENILTLVKKLPLFILQALYLEIKTILNENTQLESLNKIDKNDIIQLFIPVISDLGEIIIKKFYSNELKEPIDSKIIRFLETVKENKNMIDICITNNWNLLEGCKYLFNCMENNFIESTYSAAIHNTAGFVASNIKIGDFLLRKNLITQTQLEWALKVQDDISSAFDDKNKIVEVLSNMGYLKKEDIEYYLTLKDAAQTNFVIDDPSAILVQQIEDLTNHTNKLEEENKKLSTKLESTQNEKDQIALELGTYKTKAQQMLEQNKILLEKIEKSNKSFFNKL